MLKKAKSKNQRIDWRIGTAEKTGLPDKIVSGIIGTLAIHHWTDLKKAFSELYRALKTDGKIVIFTSTPKQMKGYWLNHYFPKMLNDSILQMPSLENVENAMRNAGIEIESIKKYSIKPDLQDQFLYCGKQNPELYFCDNIRQREFWINLPDFQQLNPGGVTPFVGILDNPIGVPLGAALGGRT